MLYYTHGGIQSHYKMMCTEIIFDDHSALPVVTLCRYTIRTSYIIYMVVFKATTR